MWPSSGVPEASSVMSVGAKRAKAKQEGAIDGTSWHPLTRRPAPRKLILLQLMGAVWTFQDPENTCLYRCEADPDGSEQWFFKVIRTEREWISPSDAARLIGVGRQAIRSAIVHGRLCTMNSNGRPVVSRAEVLALQIDDRKRGRASKQSRRT